MIEFITLLIFVILPIVGIYYSIKISENHRIKRTAMLKRQFGEDIVVIENFPIDQAVEKVIQDGLRNTIQDFREIIVGKGWIFLQVISKRIPAFTLHEDRDATVMGVYVRQLKHLSPEINIRNTKNKSFLSRRIQKQLIDQQLVWCEAEFDKNHNIFNRPGDQINTLSILTPEVLEVLMNAPGNADITIKKNQLYYMFPGNLSAEKILNELLAHSRIAAKEIEENLARWSRSYSNQDKLAEIAGSETSGTLDEVYSDELKNDRN